MSRLGERRGTPSGRRTELDRLCDAMHQPVSVRLDAPLQDRQRASRVLAQQGLAPGSDGHHARDHWQGDTVDLDRLGAAGDIFRRIRTQADGSDVDASTGLDSEPASAQSLVVGERISDGVVDRVEQQEHPIGLVDLATAPLRDQVSREPVMRRPQRRRRLFVELFGQPGTVDNVSQ
jgi:hypothetical protein